MAYAIVPHEGNSAGDTSYDFMIETGDDFPNTLELVRQEVFEWYIKSNFNIAISYAVRKQVVADAQELADQVIGAYVIADDGIKAITAYKQVTNTIDLFNDSDCYLVQQIFKAFAEQYKVAVVGEPMHD